MANAKALRLHKKALHYNWDDGLDGLRAIVDDPACD